MKQKRPLEKSVYRNDCWRVTVLTSMLIRLEYDPKQRFEDRLSQIVVNRCFPEAAYSVITDGSKIAVKTSAAEIILQPEEFQFAVALGEKTWKLGEPLHNLGGTARTLDNADGAIPLEDGLFSEEGIGILADDSCLVSGTDLFQRNADGKDIYLFLYGKQFTRGLQDFYRLCGATPLLPRYALGNWWSRFWRYTEGEYLDLMDRFQRERIPFSVAVMDMDWHITNVPEGYSGWTGYTWNRELFPNPAQFLQTLHEHGLHITLNLHPADGVQFFEQQYPWAAEAMGVTGQETIPFDFTDEKFRDVYFKILLEPMEKEGVDFWWIDWQQGTASKIPGLDPLWLLNHYHYEHAGENQARPLILSRYAGPGSHRYPVGFSGDTIVSWESLRFQPYFTATAANIGYGWWSHDIGGHMNGVKEDELTCRWVQFGVFSPINRLHSTCNRFAGKEPWNYGVEACEIMKRFLRLRHRLIPYLYAMNYRSHLAGIPLVRPLYHGFPDMDGAYRCPNAYLFGSEMIAAPITERRDLETGLAKVEVWLPEGCYYDFFTGVAYRGGRHFAAYRPLDTMPVFVKAGGIVPMETEEKKLLIRVYPGNDGNFQIYKSDENAQDREVKLTYSEAEKSLSVSAPMDSCKVCFCGVCAQSVILQNEAGETEIPCCWDEEQMGSVVNLPELESGCKVRLAAWKTAQPVLKEKTIYGMLQRANIPFSMKEELFCAYCEGNAEHLSRCAETLPQTLRDAVAELLAAE